MLFANLWLCLQIVAPIPNPVVEGVADAGVLACGGQYYLMGVGTNGGMYLSDDLVRWQGPVHAFSMKNNWAAGPAATDDNIHACDMVLHNGTFHLFWSVNHGPLRQIGHAVARTPTGPYEEPGLTESFDGRIDPQCFQDDDGRCYFYTVKFDSGNIIYGQPMENPAKLAGEPARLLSALPNTWENLDTPPTFVNEGPYVITRCGRYYMIYNANHTAPQYGHYALGVAEADSPLGFNNAGKYAFPVLRSNRDRKYADVRPAQGIPEVKNCGQPNLIRGPNGFEWWLAYFADMGKHRSQCIDRVHFFGRELYVEGPAAGETPGYHPMPAMPSFRDLFEEEEPIGNRWRLEGRWRKKQGALQADAVSGVALARVPLASSHSVIEAFLWQADENPGRFGVVAWDNGEGAALRIALDRAHRTLAYSLCGNGKITERTEALPEAFNWHGPHALRVENNGGKFSIWLDRARMNFRQPVIEDCSEGTAALFAEGCAASFESFMLTRGWDECGGASHGWRDARGQARKENPAEGLLLEPRETVFKGDLREQYEFSVQIRGNGGVYPLYVDENDFLLAEVDEIFSRIRLTGKRNGEAMTEQVFPIHPRIHSAHTAAENGHNLRFVKLRGQVILFAEGLELGSAAGAWPESRVGLLAAESPCEFLATALYELP